MDNTPANQSTISYIISFFIVSLFSTFLVIFKDLNPALKDWMKGLMYHHWITHGVFVVVLFFLLAFIFNKMKLGKKLSADKLANWLVWGVLLSGLILVVFYIKEAFFH